MFRKEIEHLISWKHSTKRKPLIIRGARQVGKTWLMKEFGNTYYDKFVYINFENNQSMEQLFNGNLDTSRLLSALEIESGISIEPHNTLLIFDEIQEADGVLTSLKYFYENSPEYQIVAAGSLLGVALHPGTSFPVGKVEFMNLYPLSFLEFLQATDRQNLVDLLKSQDYNLITAFKEKYIEALKDYYFIGGMPEAVASFAEQKDYQKVRSIQNNILTAYEQDFSKHAPPRIVPRIRLLWNSIPSQLAKEQKKFIYGLIKTGARAREYELALIWLMDSGLIHKVRNVQKPAIPLAAYAHLSAFKVYMLDVGLLAALSRLDRKSIIHGSIIFTEFKGALSEQFVFQQLLSNQQIEPYYWTSAKGASEVDFIFQWRNRVIPVEVKAAENLQAKSLKTYVARYEPYYAVRMSLSDYRKEAWLINIPLYAVNFILHFLGNE